MKDVTDTVSPALMAKVKAWKCTVDVRNIGGGLYIAKSQHRNVYGNTADGAVRQWLLDMAVDAVNGHNARQITGSFQSRHCDEVMTLGTFFAKNPEVAVQ